MAPPTYPPVPVPVPAALTWVPTRRIVLVTHGQRLMATHLEGVLRAAGYVVMVATEGAEALELARRLQPDAIVLDLALDHQDGTALSWHLRADPTTAHLPLIGLAPARRLGQPASSLCVDAVVPQPLRNAALCATVAAWLGRHR